MQREPTTIDRQVALALLHAKVESLLRRARIVVEPKAHWGKVIALVRGKGGVGTTTLAVNVGVALARSPTSRVAMLDLSVEYGNAAMLLNIQPKRTLAHLGGMNVADLAPESWAPFVADHSSGPPTGGRSGYTRARGAPQRADGPASARSTTGRDGFHHHRYGADVLGNHPIRYRDCGYRLSGRHTPPGSAEATTIIARLCWTNCRWRRIADS